MRMTVFHSDSKQPRHEVGLMTGEIIVASDQSLPPRSPFIDSMSDWNVRKLSSAERETRNNKIAKESGRDVCFFNKIIHESLSFLSQLKVVIMIG